MATKTTNTTAADTTTPAAKTTKKVVSVAHRIKAMLKTQTINGKMTVVELDDIAAHVAKMKQFAELMKD
jgi:hypothetical protein